MAGDVNKVFGDRETALILQKAAELQAERGGRSTGLTLDELRQIAGEAGIEPDLVDAALAELRRPKEPTPPPRRKVRGTRTRWEQRTELPVRLDNEDVRAVLAQLEAEFGGQGTITELSCGTVWTHYRLRRGHTHAAVEAAEGGTRIHVALERLTQRKFMRRAGGVIGTALGGFIGLATGEEAAFAILALLGIASGNLVGRGAWRMAASRFAKRLDRLMSTLSGEAMRNGTPVMAAPKDSASKRELGRAPAGVSGDSTG
ncbi:MAG: hypothetical protein ACREM1_10255 [Longimicrobiales bacterium]